MKIDAATRSVFPANNVVDDAVSLTEVTVAARIEPRVPVGAIYTTQPFAAMIESDQNELNFEYVGKMDLAKNYGERVLYRLASRNQPVPI